MRRSGSVEIRPNPSNAFLATNAESKRAAQRGHLPWWIQKASKHERSGRQASGKTTHRWSGMDKPASRNHGVCTRTDASHRSPYALIYHVHDPARTKRVSSHAGAGPAMLQCIQPRPSQTPYLRDGDDNRPLHRTSTALAIHLFHLFHQRVGFVASVLGRARAELGPYAVPCAPIVSAGTLTP